MTSLTTSEAAYLDGRSKGLVYGPQILTTGFDAILFGMTIHLFFRWFDYSWKSDSTVIRLLVIWLLLCSFAVTFFIMSYTMHLYAYNFGDYTIFERTNWGAWFFLLETVVRTPVSLFFTERAYRMTKRSKLFLAGVLPLIFGSLVAGIISSVYLKGVLSGSNAMTARFKITAYVWNISETLSDLIITVVIGINLLRSKTGWEKTNLLINRLIGVLMETQLPPTVIDFAWLIVFSIDSNSPLFPLFQWQSKMYIISLYVVLNSRIKLQREFGAEQGVSVYPTGIQVTTETYIEAHKLEAMPSRQQTPPRPILRDQLDLDDDDDYVKDEPISPRTARVAALTFKDAANVIH